MNVNVAFFGPFRRIAGTGETDMVLPENASAGDLIKAVADRFFAEKPEVLEGAMAARNGIRLPGDAPLRDGDRILILSPMISGG